MTAFINCRATECFISQEFIDAHKLGTRKLHDPRLLQNADGSANMGGNVTDYTDLKITTGNKTSILQFYVANMGGDNLILGYPWFTAHDPRPDWAAGTLSEEVELRTAGAARVRPTSLLPEPKPQAIIGQDGPLVPVTGTCMA